MTSGIVAVLNADPEHDLSALIRHPGLETRVFGAIDELRAASDARIDVLVAAFDAMLPNPQLRLDEIRLTCPGVRVVLIYRDVGERPRLLDRLWSTGACYAVLPASTPSPRIRALLQQAMIEARFERMCAEHQLPQPSNALELITFLQQLTIALAGQSNSHGLLRELSARLPQVIECSMFGVLLLGSPSKLVTFQARAVDNSVLWELADVACDAIRPFKVGGALTAGELEFLLGPPIVARAGDHPTHETLAWPMVVAGEAIGSLAVVVAKNHPRRGELMFALQLIASQLGAALRHVQLVSDLEARTQIDPLTGLHNRQYTPQVLEREWRRAQRYSLHLSVVLLDVDGFHRLNQLYGAIAGDTVIKELATLLREHVRGTDHLLSYGGDRFLLILTETAGAGASLAVERIRTALKSKPIIHGSTPLGLSFSAGIASYPTSRVDVAMRLVTLAEGALEEAKNAGGDRTNIVEPAKKVDAAVAKGEERRINPRIPVQVPTTFLPLPDLDFSRLLRLPTINLSSNGIALRDPTRQLKRRSHGLVFFDDRPEPTLCKVVWVKSHDGEHSAGLQAVRSSDLIAKSERATRRPRRALVIVGDEARRTMIQRVLRSVRYDVRVVDPQATKLDEKMLKSSSLVVMSAFVLSRPAGQQVLEVRGGTSSPLRLIVLNDALAREQAIDMVSAHKIEHLISGEESQAELLFTTLAKLSEQDYFGARRYLLPGADCKRWVVGDSTEKSYALAGVRTVAGEVGCHPLIIDLLISAVDEMIIHMLFSPSAPAAEGRRLVSVECGCDGRFLGVSVLDEQGGLRIEEMYRDLGAAAENRKKALQESATSARLGFRIMLDALSQISINVEPGARTEIIGLVDLRRSLREYRSSAPSIGVFGPE